jgi:hypothetical protein
MAIEKVVNIKVSDNIDATTQHVGSLKSELRKAQQEVAALSDKFGATSKEAVEAAKRAAELKDRIGDAKNLTDAFNPDAKFKALSSSLSGVASGFAAYQGALGLAGAESKDLEKQLLKVQSAMAVAQGLQGLGEAKDSFVQLKAVAINAFNGIKAAIGSTGIGLLVIALGTIYTYWDDIKETVSGVSDEQREQNDLLNEGAKKSKEQLSSLNAQDETLKRSGKTEREILSIKEKQTQEAINQQIIAIENNIKLRKIQEETAERNKQILKGILDFIASPIIGLLGGIDMIGEKFGKNFGLVDKFKESTANLFFDPKKTKEEGDAATKEDKKVLAELINQRDGYHNQIKSIDEAAAKEKQQKDLEAKKKQEELDAKRLTALDDELTAILDQEQRIKDSEDRKSQLKIDALDDELTRMLEFDERVKENEQKAIERKRILKEQEIALTESTFGKIADLAGRNSKIGKAFALGQAIINTYQGITAELQTKAVTPYEIGLKIANVALVAATGFKAVNSILATNPMSPSVSGGGSSGISGGSGVTAPSFNIVGQNSNNQLAQSISNKQNQPVEAYVVSGKMSSALSLDRNRIDTATFN